MTGQPVSPYRIVISFPDGTSTTRHLTSKADVREYHKRNVAAMTKTGGLFTVKDASGRDVTNEVL